MAVWGTNFVVIHYGLEQFPPFTFATLRFMLAAFPALLFVPKPRLSWIYFAGFGGFIGAGQFGLLYLAMSGHIEPGLASLVVQTQVFFTIALSMLLRRERVSLIQGVSLAFCAMGLGLIAAGTGGATSILGVLLVLAAALSWAMGNLVVKSAGTVPMLGLVIWGSAFAVPPLLVMAVLADGSAAIVRSIGSADIVGWAALFWQAAANTLFGYAAWSWLLSRHPAALITPTSLLVPVFGMSAAAIALGEPMPTWKLAAATLIISGLSFNLLAPLLSRRLAANTDDPLG